MHPRTVIAGYVGRYEESIETGKASVRDGKITIELKGRNNEELTCLT
jgi:hypothetical protein